MIKNWQFNKIIKKKYIYICIILKIIIIIIIKSLKNLIYKIVINL